MCLSCGYYNGRQVMDLEAKKQKRDARLKAKEEMIRGQRSEAENAPETEEKK